MAAPARPYWTGFLKLSLVTISVRLYTAATEKDRVRFHQIHEPSGERVKQQLIVPGIGPVERDEIVKGYEYEKGHYITVDPDDIKRLRLETTDTIDIVEFVEDVDPIYFDTPYYLVPDGNVAEEGYRVIREALRQTNKIAVGQVVVNGQERIIAIRPLGTGLLGNSLRYDDEIRKPQDYFGSISDEGADDDQLAIMEQIIKRKTREFDPSQFKDKYQDALRELIAEKMEGKQIPPKEPERRPAQVINLMDALKRSLAAEDKGAEAAPRRIADEEKEAATAETKATATGRGRKATAPTGQRNLLLPVNGGRGKAAASKTAPAAAAPEAEAAPKRRKRA
ncbi:MAG TPA: Ku protein [Stellaceae bacterium]|jgi:DNA end-binding protein Ku|nr:Ku protein [Stellaceae bacterium]